VSESSPETQLEELLRDDVSSLVSRERSEFDQLLAPFGEAFVLFGAGRLGRTALAALRKAGIEPLAFSDNNPLLWHKPVDGLQVLPPQEAAQKLRHKAVFVITVYTSDPVRRQLLGLDLKVVSFASLSWAYPEAFLPHGALELPFRIYEEAEHVRSVISLWADDTSRSEYLAQLRWRTSLNPDVLPAHLPRDQIYFPNDLVSLSRDEVFVDCGAFDGDTIREFLKRRGPSFKHMIAIEPDPANYQRLRAYCSTLPRRIRRKTTTMQVAVGSRRGPVRFNATGTAASAVGSGSTEVEGVPLDEVLSDNAPTYIKMDLEGTELDALLGARRVMEEASPILAICLYHRQEHLWRIPLFIDSVSRRYSLFLRRYSDDCWEQVCYAVPPGRVPASRV